MTNPTPVGESALSAGQARAKPMAEGTPVNEEGKPVGVPQTGPTPVGESVRSVPPAPDPVPVERTIAENRQAMRNLALLARTAIGQNYPTMQVDPKMVAAAALAFEEALGETALDSMSAPKEPVALATSDDAYVINTFKPAARNMVNMTGGPVGIWHNDQTGETQLVGGNMENPGVGWRRLYTALPTEGATADEDPAPEPFRGPGQK